MVVYSLARGITRERRGAVLVEFALLLPLFMTLLMGVLCYGQYIWLAHSAQAIANDAARATLAGLSAAEREAIARNVVTTELASVPALKPEKVSVVVSEAGGRITVALRVDARAMTLLHSGFVPLPDPVITRIAIAPLASA